MTQISVKPDPKTDLAIAGAAVAMALIDKLMQRGVLNRGDALAVLSAAEQRCVDIGQPHAGEVIRDAYAKMSSGG